MYKKQDITYGSIRTAEELGWLMRANRKQQNLTLERFSGLAKLGTRFLSEFERGKETAEIGKVIKAINTLGLEVVIQPRSWKTHSSNIVKTPK